MTDDRLDCSWCGSARSIEHGLCQVCLMEYPLDTKIITLPTERRIASRVPIRRVKIDMTQGSTASPRSAG